MSYDAGPRDCGRTSEDLIKERENLIFVKRKLLENIHFFTESNLDIDSSLDLFKKTLLSKLQEDLSNLSKKDCKLKETAKLILEYNKLVNESMLPIHNLGYVITPFYTKENIKFI